MEIRNILVIIIMLLSITDLTLTFYYVNKYKSWQKEKPYNLMENNPLLVFLWNNFGFILGSIIGAIIILTLVYFISKTLWIGFPIVLLCILLWTMYNHFNNITLLWKLIEKYPTGVLPEAVFGVVVGNNIK
jgi:hypothetical protein